MCPYANGGEPADPVETVRVVVVTDTTGSMGSYCISLGDTLPQVFSVLRVLCAGKAQVDVVAYEDYCDGERLCRTCYGTEAEAIRFVDGLKAGGGGDYPEASKTALNNVVSHLRQAVRCPTLLLFYTDAPPHHTGYPGANQEHERLALRGTHPGFDWLAIAAALKDLDVVTYSFVPPSVQDVALRYQALLGPVVELPDTYPRTITKATMGVVLQAMGQDFPEAAAFKVHSFAVPPAVHNLTEDNDEGYLKASIKALTDRVLQADVESLMAMGFSCGMSLEALRRANGRADDAVSMLLDGRVPTMFTQMQGLQKLAVSTLTVSPLAGWRRDLSPLLQLFDQDEAFCDATFATLREVMDVQRPHRTLALTYNKVLGLLWRLACRRREDERLHGLGEALGQCVGKLEGEDKEKLRTWIDDSYDQTEEIRNLVDGVPVAGGVLVLDGRDTMTLPSKDDMRSLVHGPTSAVLAAVQKLLTAVIRIDAADASQLPRNADGVPLWIPLGLDDKQLFRMLPHLALPGLMVTLRPACIMALLASLSGNKHLQQRAEALLEERRGKWIPSIDKVADYPEILAPGFVRLLGRSDQFLTPKEAELYSRLNHMLRCRDAYKLRLEVKCGFIPRIEMCTPDDKAPCDTCKKQRSLSLMVGNKCGLCIYGVQGDEPQADASHMVQCRQCAALYAVVNTHQLTGEPKCYYCRKGAQPAPVLQCRMCDNRFVRPSATAEQQNQPFTCAPCRKQGIAVLTDLEVPLEDLAADNPELLRALGYTPEQAKLLWSRKGLYKMWDQHQELFVAAEVCPESAPAELTWKMKRVHNTSVAVESALQRIKKGELSGSCNLCFEDRPVGMLRSACGRCNNMACEACLRTWYESLKPGRIYTPTLGLCPFCKRRPTGKVLVRYNKQACSIVTGKNRVVEGVLRGDMLYAWCLMCYQVKEAMGKTCGERFDASAIQGFVCSDCQDNAGVEKVSRPCPACNAPTEKESGCDHMHCLCGASWCWRCSKLCEDGEDIYEHMMEEHGTIGIDGADEE